MIGRKIEMIHNEILIYIAYKEGLIPKSEYIEYLKSQLQTMIDDNITDKESE